MPDPVEPNGEPILTKTEPAWVWSTALPEIFVAVVVIGMIVIGALVWAVSKAIF